VKKIIKIENHCVDCGLTCLGAACPYRFVSTYYCDCCKTDEVEYILDGEHLCEGCAKEYLSDIFYDMSIAEQAEALGVTCIDFD
jgi:hypothetical protein